MNTQTLDIDSAVRQYRLRHTGKPECRIRAALIDMDGTLYDSMRNHAAAWHRMMTKAGFPSNPDEYFLFEGMTGAATINLLLNRYLHRDATPEEIEKMYYLKTVYFNESPAVPPMPGAVRMLETLADMGIKRILVTGSGQASLIDRLTRDFPGHFRPDELVTSNNVSRGKPDPEPYLKGMEIAGVLPEEAIVIENAPLGVKAGARSGAFTIGVTTGPVPAESLLSEGADIVFPSMPVLADHVRELTDKLNTLSSD